MLTRQDVKYCSTQEFNATLITFQFYQVSKISCYCRIESVSSQFPDFLFLWLVTFIMNRPNNVGNA